MVVRKIENRDLRIDQSFDHNLLITSLLVFDILNIVIIGSIKIVLYLYKLLSSPRTVRNQFISFGLTFTVRYFFDRRTFFQYVVYLTVTVRAASRLPKSSKMMITAEMSTIA